MEAEDIRYLNRRSVAGNKWITINTDYFADGRIEQLTESVVDYCMEKNKEQIINALSDAILYNGTVLTSVTYSDGEIKVEHIPSDEWMVKPNA